MSVCRAWSFALLGIDASPVEVNVSAGLPGFSVVGLPMGLSGRAHDRILRVARTVADLSGTLEIEAEHIAEALNYRRSRFIDR